MIGSEISKVWPGICIFTFVVETTVHVELWHRVSLTRNKLGKSSAILLNNMFGG